MLKQGLRIRLRCVAALGAALTMSCAGAFEYDPETPTATAVRAAKDAVKAKQWSKLPGLAEQAQNDVLRIYADYWLAEREVWVAKDINNVPVAEAFLVRYPNSYMADKLRANWVLAAVQSGAFPKVGQLGQFTWYNKQVRCAKLEARHMTGQRVTAMEAVEEFSPGEDCWSMLGQFVADGVVAQSQLAVILKDAIERNHTRTAQKIAALMFDKNTEARYQSMMASPAKWLRSVKGKPTGNEALLVSIGLARMARDNLTGTAQYVKSDWAKRLPAAALGWVWGQLGFRAALAHDPQSYTWYRNAGNVPLSDDNYAWRVRATLRQPVIDWAWLQSTIEWMPERQREEIDWQYWLARSLAAQGELDQANQIYQRISDQFHFYGQLALEELGQQIVAPAKPAPVSEQELEQARNNPDLQQAVALFKLGLRPEAVPQWNFGIRGMTDRQLLAAAEFAREQQIYDRVVNTSDRTSQQVDFSQRFIAPFEGQVTAQATSINLDPAWVYGLIRQESRFIMDARSVVGASGLMQLMPATAKYVAKKIGMTDFRPAKVNEFDVNTKLGTHYLSMVLEDLDGSQVLASAGYNAGPGRPTQWRKTLSRPVEGAIFAETIPFSETREYVKNVLSNATYYAAIFSGQPQSLKARLGQIAPK